MTPPWFREKVSRSKGLKLGILSRPVGLFRRVRRYRMHTVPVPYAYGTEWILWEKYPYGENDFPKFPVLYVKFAEGVGIEYRSKYSNFE